MKKTFLVIVTGLVISVFLYGTAWAEQGRPSKDARKGGWDKERGERGQGMDKQKKNRPPISIPLLKLEGMKEEFQRHRTALQEIFKSIMELRKEIRASTKDRVDEMREERRNRPRDDEMDEDGDGTDSKKRPPQPRWRNKDKNDEEADKRGPEGKGRGRLKKEYDAIAKKFEPRAKKLAEALLKEMNLHRENVAKIVKANNDEVIEHLTRRILAPSFGRPKNMKDGMREKKDEWKDKRNERQEGRKDRRAELRDKHKERKDNWRDKREDDDDDDDDDEN